MTASEYNTCVRRHADNVYRFAFKSLRNIDLAKDVVQESFMRLWENKEAVLKGKEKSYLFTIAYRLIIDDIRLANRYGSNQGLHQQPDGRRKSAYSDLSEILMEHIERLPPKQKNLILLRDYEGYSYREISEITQMTEAQVKVYIFRARTSLRKSIGDINNILE